MRIECEHPVNALDSHDLKGDRIHQAQVASVLSNHAIEGPVVDAMVKALLEHDPQARAVPYTLSGGTDAKAFANLGIPGYGFAPLRLPPSLAFADLFHGVDERVPVDALEFGARVLDRFLDLA